MSVATSLIIYIRKRASTLAQTRADGRQADNAMCAKPYTHIEAPRCVPRISESQSIGRDTVSMDLLETIFYFERSVGVVALRSKPINIRLGWLNGSEYLVNTSGNIINVVDIAV